MAGRPQLVRKRGQVVQKRLYRSESNRVIAGIGGGLGDYLGIDPTLVRLFFVVLGLATGSGLLIYLLLWIVIPKESRVGRATSDLYGNATSGQWAEGDAASGFGGERNRQAGAVLGAGLVVLGSLFLLQNLNVVWFRWFDLDILWPALLIIGGLALMWQRLKGVA